MREYFDKSTRPLHVGSRVLVDLDGKQREGRIARFEDQTGSVWIDHTDLHGSVAMPEELDLLD